MAAICLHCLSIRNKKQQQKKRPNYARFCFSGKLEWGKISSTLVFHSFYVWAFSLYTRITKSKSVCCTIRMSFSREKHLSVVTDCLSGKKKQNQTKQKLVMAVCTGTSKSKGWGWVYLSAYHCLECFPRSQLVYNISLVMWKCFQPTCWAIGSNFYFIEKIINAILK